VACSLFAVSIGWCTQSNLSSCSFEIQVCCNNECVFGSGCLGRFCSRDSDCAVSEICCINECVFGSDCLGHYCSTDSDCGLLFLCCNHFCISGSSCIGQVCSDNSDCATSESSLSCCSGRCRSDCLGYSCSSDTDCGFYEYCCDGKCSYDSVCYDPTAVIIGSVCGVLIFSCLLSMCFYYACRRRRVHHGRVIVGQRVTTATVRTTRTTPQPYPPYVGQIPPPYQQGYQYYPPPQYEQHQTAVPPPYNPGTTATNDQPPPYSAATQGRSGGVYNPKPSYGAIQTPSAPPPV
ncbi:unnamed protein product, partial [Porites evermanni]